MAVGAVVIIATRAIAKPLVYYTSCLLVKVSPSALHAQKHDIRNKKKLIVELATKFFVYFAVGFNCLFTVPSVFRAIGCERSTFHTEV